MTLLLAGLALWVLGHGFKRIAPDLRERLGNRGRAISAVTILLGVVLMVLGFRGWHADPVYDPPGWGLHVNNSLMFVAIFLMGAGSAGGRVAARIRHPMLTGMVVWAIAHLLVNGDGASVLLFGTLGLWALAEMVVISRAEGPWQRPEPGPISRDLRGLVITAVVYMVIAGIHWWLGYYPFPQG